MEEKEKKQSPVLEFFIKTLNGMAYGLFATLIIGTIFGAIGKLFSYGTGNSFCDFMTNLLGNNGAGGISYVLQILTGAGIGVGIALTLKLDPLKTIVLAAVGEIAAFLALSTSFVSSPSFTFGNIKPGDPLTIYLVCISVALLMKLVLTKKTPVDILIVPLFGVAVGIVASILLRYPAIYVTYGVQWLVNECTNAVPFIMGLVIAVLMGMALTAPISSAAIGAMVFTINLTPDEIAAAGGYSALMSNPAYSGLLLASGAAIIGCCTQMVGFAVQSRKDNSVGMVISIGIGTSMLQFKNVLKNPLIWLPTIITSAILGPVSTCWLKLICMSSYAGMGTAGLVGQIGTIADTGAANWQTWVGLFGFEIIAPALLVFAFDLLFRKLGWIKPGDLKV